MKRILCIIYRELVYELHKREKEVYLISGGFKSIIEPIARSLDIPTSNVYANKLKFFYDGELLIIFWQFNYFSSFSNLRIALYSTATKAI